MLKQPEIEPAAIPALPPGGAILFPCGLPGFKEHRQFSLSFPPELAPLIYLESAAPPYPRFLLLPAALVDPHYRFHMEPWDQETLYSSSGTQPSSTAYSDLSLYFVVSVAKDSPPTVNMLAPIAIRPADRRGVQAVRSDSIYSHAMPLALLNEEAR